MINDAAFYEYGCKKKPYFRICPCLSWFKVLSPLQNIEWACLKSGANLKATLILKLGLTSKPRPFQVRVMRFTFIVCCWDSPPERNQTHRKPNSLKQCGNHVGFACTRQSHGSYNLFIGNNLDEDFLFASLSIASKKQN